MLSVALEMNLPSCLQADIKVTLQLRSPVVLKASPERPNLHLSCCMKPCEDSAFMAALLADLILGNPCSLAPGPLKLAPPNTVPATIIYCVSKVEVETLRTVMNTNPKLRGLVREQSGK
jgi:superfamily II DNA helicase RecQ